MCEEEIMFLLEYKHKFLDILYEYSNKGAVEHFEKAIDGILDLYNKKKKEYQQLQAFYLKDYIRKDKIKEKIEELEKEINGEWREQECSVRSAQECIELYGLGIDGDFEIISIEE